MITRTPNVIANKLSYGNLKREVVSGNERFRLLKI